MRAQKSEPSKRQFCAMKTEILQIQLGPRKATFTTTLPDLKQCLEVTDNKMSLIQIFMMLLSNVSCNKSSSAKKC